MIAATKVELRGLLGNNWTRLGIFLAILSPLIAFCAGSVLNRMNDGSHFIEVAYSDALYGGILMSGIAGMIVGAVVATNSHRHRVFQSYIVTGHARDLLFVGRLFATWAVTTAIFLGCVGIAMALHAMSFGDRSPICTLDNDRCIPTYYAEMSIGGGGPEMYYAGAPEMYQDDRSAVYGAPGSSVPYPMVSPGSGYDDGIAGTAPTPALGDPAARTAAPSDPAAAISQELPFIYWDQEEQLSSLPLARIAADIGSGALLVYLAVTFAIGLTTLTRSIIATGVIIPVYLGLEDGLGSALRESWHRAAEVVPLTAMHDVPVRVPDRWWDVQNAVVVMSEHPYGSEWFESAALLAVWAIAACLAGFYRMSWRDA